MLNALLSDIRVYKSRVPLLKWVADRSRRAGRTNILSLRINDSSSHANKGIKNKRINNNLIECVLLVIAMTKFKEL